MFNFHTVNSLLQYYGTEGTSEFFAEGGDSLMFLRHFKFNIDLMTDEDLISLKSSLNSIRRLYTEEIAEYEKKRQTRDKIYTIDTYFTRVHGDDEAPIRRSR